MAWPYQQCNDSDLEINKEINKLRCKKLSTKPSWGSNKGTKVMHKMMMNPWQVQTAHIFNQGDAGQMADVKGDPTHPPPFQIGLGGTGWQGHRRKDCHVFEKTLSIQKPQPN